LHSWHLLASLPDCIAGTTVAKCLSISYDGWSLVSGLDFILVHDWFDIFLLAALLVPSETQLLEYGFQ